MRPLPVLIPLDEQPDVYQEQPDSFVTLFQQELDGHDSLLSELLGNQNTLASNVAGIGDSIDNISSSVDVLFSTFDTLSAVLDTVDLSGIISDVFSLDSDLESNLDGWSPDIPALAANLFASLLAQIGQLLKDFLVFVIQIIKDLFATLLGVLFSLLNTEGGPPGPGVPGQPTPI